MGGQTVILAGGLGTRMQASAGGVPKHLIPIAGVPFCDYQLRWLARHGVSEVVYSIGYLGEAIRSYVGDGERYGLGVRYVDEGTDLKGTAGALRLCLDQGVLRDHFLVVYGDSFLRVDFGGVLHHFVGTSLPAMMTVFRNEGAWDRSNAVYRGGRVVLYDKRPEHFRPEMHWIDYGLSGLTAATVESRVGRGVKADLGELFLALSMEGLLAGWEASERFFEIGSPRGLRDFEKWVGSARG